MNYEELYQSAMKDWKTTPILPSDEWRQFLAFLNTKEEQPFFYIFKSRRIISSKEVIESKEFSAWAMKNSKKLDEFKKANNELMGIISEYEATL